MPFHLLERWSGPCGSAPLRRGGMPFGPHLRPSRGMARWAGFLAALLIIGSAGAQAEAKTNIRLGAVENVALLPWGVVMPARIDTGAATSSLDARNISIRGKKVEFNLPPQYGGRRITLPIYKWITIKSAETQERRPVVILELCIGSKRVKTHMNLNDRANVKYPVLIGRNTLKHGFLVECGTSYCSQPSCPEVKPR
jgi:hypothetical protein